MPVDNTEPLSIYRAGPGYDNCLADMLLRASRGCRRQGLLDHLLALPRLEALRVLARLARQEGQHAGRIEHTLVALVDGVCAGTLTLREDPPEAYRPLSPDPLREVFAGLGLARATAHAALDRQEAFLSLMPGAAGPFPAGRWRVQYLAVRPENRAGGVARGLLLRARDEAARAGAASLGLCCPLGAPPAWRLFSAMGYAAESVHRFPPELAHLGEGYVLLGRRTA